MNNQGEIFNNIFEGKKWGDIETVSGEGSTLANTEAIRKKIPYIIDKYNIKTLVDSACGDYNWFKNCNVNLDKYTGIDIVSKLIESNKNKYEDDKHHFECMNLCESIVPKSDLILCRDCFIHLSFEDCIKILQNFVKSGSKYLLISSNPRAYCNADIKTGGFHHINMTISPFNFPPPLEIINEEFAAYSNWYIDRNLSLWYINDIAEIIKSYSD